jgi:hypothetical protein
VKQINVVAFQFKLQASMKIHLMFHVFLLKPYHASTILRRIMIPLHLLKSMVNKNMKWRTFWICGSLIINPNILFINMGMMWASALGNQLRIHQMLYRKCMNFINDIWIGPNLFLVELVFRKGGDVMDANAMKFIHMNDHLWLVINLYPTFSLISVHF